MMQSRVPVSPGWKFASHTFFLEDRIANITTINRIASITTTKIIAIIITTNRIAIITTINGLEGPC